MKNGERISGWSAANEKTIANSQASLDLNAIADLFVPPLRSALATPLKSGHRVVGAVTAYATREEPFTDDHRYAFERLASSFADHFQITISAGVNSNALLRFPMADLTPGWNELMKSMRPGDHWMVRMPPNLMYGAEGDGRIPANANVIFEVRLDTVIYIDAPPEPAPAAPTDPR